MRTPGRRTKSSWPSRDSRSESLPSKSNYPICFRRHDQATLVAATLPVSDDKMNLPSSPSTSPRSRQPPPGANKLLFFPHSVASAIARAANKHLVRAPRNSLEPLHSVLTGEPIPDFPKTLRDVNRLSGMSSIRSYIFP
jgi:hypothetical protein